MTLLQALNVRPVSAFYANLQRSLLGLKEIPLSWLLPRRSNLFAAIVSSILWEQSIQQALFVAPHGASVYSFFGTGLVYLVFTMCNLAGAISRAREQHRPNGGGQGPHPQHLIGLFVVLSFMLACNVAVLATYIWKGVPFTKIDALTMDLSGLVVLGVIDRYGKSMFSNPIARGFLAIAGKTIPQVVLTVMFIQRPTAALGLAFFTAFGVVALSSQRFTVVCKDFLHDKLSKHFQGLMIGEGGNAISGIAMFAAWGVAQLNTWHATAHGNS